MPRPIPGEVLLNQHRPVTPPGVTHPNASYPTVVVMILIIIAVAWCAWVMTWLVTDPMPECVTPPTNAVYRNVDNTWLVAGLRIGYGKPGDPSCLIPVG
jgi:hypothetical protein